MSEVSKNFKVGDKVKVVSHKNTVKRFGGNSGLLAEIGTESIVNTIGDFCIGITGSMFLLDIDDVVLLDNLKLVNKETMSEQTLKTPYQEKGYTENSLFKFVGEDGEFEEGEILKLNYDDGTFTLSYISTTTSDVSYLCFNEVEYVGEEGDEDVVKQPPNYEEVAKQPSKTDQGIKYDSGKLEYSLIPKGVLTPIIRVLQQGCQKYSKDNWQRVDNPKERYYNALQRHIGQWWEGEKYDAETGENHLTHAACCLMFLLWFDNKDEQELQSHKDITQSLLNGKD